jgi:hypothetical protein
MSGLFVDESAALADEANVATHTNDVTARRVRHMIGPWLKMKRHKHRLMDKDLPTNVVSTMR